ncbi:hypothetical protein KFF05_00450 [bacterium SCSIO 12827]|nr:hypothetical protein KFF05_00450 [bacterium SCSIO 12827]
MILFLKVLVGVFAFVSAIITFIAQGKDANWHLWRVSRTILRVTGFTCFVLSSVGYIYFDYRDETLRQAADAEFRAAMIDVSRDIMRSAHPYHPKEVRFDYCFDSKDLMAIAKKKWGDVSLAEAQSSIRNLGEKAFREIFGSSVTIFFTKQKTFREGFYRDLKSDIAVIHLEPHQVSKVIHFPRIEETSEKAFCQHVIFSVPEVGFNAFDSYNAVQAHSYYDLTGSHFFLYLKASKLAQILGLSSPFAKNLSVAFGNGVRKFYLQKDKRVESKTIKAGRAYRQESDIPAIEEDYPSLRVPS